MQCSATGKEREQGYKYCSGPIVSKNQKKFKSGFTLEVRVIIWAECSVLTYEALHRLL